MEKEKNSFKKWIIILSIICIVAAGFLITLLIIMNSGYKKDSNSSLDNTYYNNDDDPNSNNKTTTKEMTESEKMIVKLYELIDENLVFDTGNYIEGDIPAGEYAFIKFSEGGSYYEEDDAAGNILDNENFDSFGYVKVHAVGNLETRGILVNIQSFEKLGVSGAKEIYEILNDKDDWNQAGFYKVGTDIEPGKYILESIGEGYWAILSGPVSDNKIVNNDNFNGRATVTLKNGQYLELHRAKLSKAE